MILKVPFVSLVNLIAGKEVVTELVAGDMQVKAIKQELSYILPGSERRKRMLENYDCLIQILGKAGASGRAARQMLQALSAYKKRLYQLNMINHSCRYRHQCTIETVEHTSVSRQDVSRILDAQCPFDDSVRSPRAEHHDSILANPHP